MATRQYNNCIKIKIYSPRLLAPRKRTMFRVFVFSLLFSAKFLLSVYYEKKQNDPNSELSHQELIRNRMYIIVCTGGTSHMYFVPTQCVSCMYIVYL